MNIAKSKVLTALQNIKLQVPDLMESVHTQPLRWNLPSLSTGMLLRAAPQSAAFGALCPALHMVILSLPWRFSVTWLVTMTSQLRSTSNGMGTNRVIFGESSDLERAQDGQQGQQKADWRQHGQRRDGLALLVFRWCETWSEVRKRMEERKVWCSDEKGESC